MKRLVFLVMLMSAGAALFADAIRATIKEFSGTVEVKAANTDVWKPVSVGMVIEGNSFISTGFKSLAVLSVGNSTITVQPLSRLSLEQLLAQDGGEQVNLNLRAGRVRAEVAPPPEGKIAFTVRSPSATSSVRGTAFEFDTVNLRVLHGTVAYTDKDGTQFLVSAGSSASIGGDGKSVAPEQFADSRLKAPAIVEMPSTTPVSPVVSSPGGGSLSAGAVGGGSKPTPGTASAVVSW